MNFHGSEFGVPFRGPRPRVPFQPHVRFSRYRPRPPSLLSESLLLPSHQQPPPMFGPRGATMPPTMFGPRGATMTPNYFHRNPNPRSIQNDHHFDHHVTDDPYWCETCDRGFKTSVLLENHKSQHQKCNIDGCQFVAHSKVITKHIQMQHSSGLYSKIAKLSDPEEIKKWRDERRRKFPTKANIDKKQAEIKEKIERGEKMGLKRKVFPDNSNNVLGSRKRQPANRRKPKLRKVENACPESKPKHNLLAFTGINQLSKQSDSEEETCINESNFVIDDEIYDNIPQNISNDVEGKLVCGAITHLISNYGSTDEDDESNVEGNEKCVENVNKTNSMQKYSLCAIRSNTFGETSPANDIKSTTLTKDITVGSDDSGPEEMQIEKKKEEIAFETKTAPEKPVMKKELSRNVGPSKVQGKFLRNNTRKLPSTLLEKLLSNEIRHERNITLQCVRYIVKNNYFET